MRRGKKIPKEEWTFPDSWTLHEIQISAIIGNVLLEHRHMDSFICHLAAPLWQMPSWLIVTETLVAPKPELFLLWPPWQKVLVGLCIRVNTIGLKLTKVSFSKACVFNPYVQYNLQVYTKTMWLVEEKLLLFWWLFSPPPPTSSPLGDLPLPVSRAPRAPLPLTHLLSPCILLLTSTCDFLHKLSLTVWKTERKKTSFKSCMGGSVLRSWDFFCFVFILAESEN